MGSVFFIDCFQSLLHLALRKEWRRQMRDLVVIALFVAALRSRSLSSKDSMRVSLKTLERFGAS